MSIIPNPKTGCHGKGPRDFKSKNTAFQTSICLTGSCFPCFYPICKLNPPMTLQPKVDSWHASVERTTTSILLYASEIWILWKDFPIPNNPCMAHLPTCTIKNKPNVGKYTLHGWYGYSTGIKLFLKTSWNLAILLKKGCRNIEVTNWKNTFHPQSPVSPGWSCSSHG